MKFNTAIFYDIENLIGGYGTHADDISELSLKEIVNEIRKVDILGEVAVQKAYANWSDNRLSSMRNDIVKLGIEPIQMFGFGKGATKNASDIQLAIDAVDLANSRPSIETYVIVSGDGGFSCLAKKLHEYGKAVVGCAYRRTTNKVFEAVCDRFVWIEQHIFSEKVHLPSTTLIVSDPILKEFMAKWRIDTADTLDDLENITHRIIEIFKKSGLGAYQMRREGLNVSLLIQALTLGIEDFRPIRFGFPKQIELLRYLLRNSSLQLVLKEPSEYRLTYRDVTISGFHPVPDISVVPSLHSLDTYKKVLLTGSPSYRLSCGDHLASVADTLVRMKDEIKGYTLDELTDRIAQACQLDPGEVKNILYPFVLSGSFERTPENKGIADQTLSLKVLSKDQILGQLWNELYHKILSAIGTVDLSVFRQMIGDDDFQP